MNSNNATQHYQQVGVQTGVMDANPHRLVQMLMEGTLEKIALAKGNMQRREITDKGANISKALNIIEGLRASLDKQAGGEIAENLDDLYDYMARRLVLANAQDKVAILDEVASLMQEVKSSWDVIG